LRCIDVVVPGPWWNALVYAFDGESAPAEGVRVKVPLGRGERVGFAAGPAYDFSETAMPPGALKKLKYVKEVLDETPPLGDELWSLAGWIGKTFLCGMGEALQIICPTPILQGEPFSPCPAPPGKNGAFQEILFYHPLDEERFAYYRERLSNTGERVLLLFPEAKESAVFFTRLPKEIKANALLWPSSGGKKLWDAWNKTASGEARIVIGAQGAVFAPFYFDEFIVDDESNPAYLFHRSPRLSARSLTGRRAQFLKGRIVLGGRMPSGKTFLRSHPECQVVPDRKNLVFVDMGRSFKTVIRGIEGQIPLTRALIEHTQATLSQGRHVFWIMDRKGQAGEVCCSDCGETLYCSRCGSVMRTESENTGNTGPQNAILRCVRCGLKEALPAQCPACRGTLLLGKRPGLEELLPLAARYVKGYDVLSDVKQKPAAPSLILGTRKLLSLCSSLDVGLVAWLDLDAEGRKVEYNARFQAFSMVWESCWRGLRQDGDKDAPKERPREKRIVLIQTRRPGSGWQRSLWLGWDHFWKRELQERKHLNVPPYSLWVQIDLPDKKDGTNRHADKQTLLQMLEKANIFAMDPGDEKSPLWVTVKSTDRLAAALAPRFEIKHSRLGFPVVTVWTE
jgi:primosomal protein N' (replication factor Y)